MRVPRRRRLYGAIAAALAAIVVVVLCLVPRAVRYRAGVYASRHDLDLQVGTVRPGWFCVHLLDVAVASRDVSTLRASFPEVVVDVTFGLHVARVDVRAGSVELNGSPEIVRSRLDAHATGSAVAGEPTLVITASHLSGEWHDGLQNAAWQDVALTRDSSGLRIEAGHAAVHEGPAQLSVEKVDAQLGQAHEVERVHAGSVTLGWASSPDHQVEIEQGRNADPTLPAAASTDPAAGTEAELLPRLPGPKSIRDRLSSLAQLVDARLPVGAEVVVDRFTWQVGASDPRAALTVGPGPLSVRRTDSLLDLRYASGEAGDGTTLTVQALVQTGAGDSSIVLDGGPVALSVLGVHEGARGLVDVEHATVRGRATLHLAGDGTALTFDVDGAARNVSLREPSLAPDLVRGLDVQLTARGTLDDAGTLRLDDVGATFGLLHLAGSGVLEQRVDNALASFRFELPSTMCQSLVDSIPTALLPDLQGTKWAGTFGARGRFALDTRDPDALELSYEVQDLCRAVEVPPVLARARFKQPFRQRIYLPDGSTAEQATGPGSQNWTSLGDISPYMQVAVMTTEDGAFPYHHGFNVAAIKASIIANIKARRFVRGASTITMQLAKNLFLTRKKTLSRKLEEVVLTDYLEQVFSKDELMELYLNVVEFGPAVYGITAASEYYFGRTPAELNVAECLFLSSLLPSPRRYGAMRDLDEAPESWMRGLRNLMRIARKRHLLSDANLDEALGEKVVFWHGGTHPPARLPVRQRTPFDPTDSDDTGTPMDSP